MPTVSIGPLPLNVGTECFRILFVYDCLITHLERVQTESATVEFIFKTLQKDEGNIRRKVESMYAGGKRLKMTVLRSD